MNSVGIREHVRNGSQGIENRRWDAIAQPWQLRPGPISDPCGYGRGDGLPLSRWSAAVRWFRPRRILAQMLILRQAWRQYAPGGALPWAPAHKVLCKSYPLHSGS